MGELARVRCDGLEPGQPEQEGLAGLTLQELEQMARRAGVLPGVEEGDKDESANWDDSRAALRLEGLGLENPTPLAPACTSKADKVDPVSCWSQQPVGFGLYEDSRGSTRPPERPVESRG